MRVVLLECRAGESNLTRAFAVHARTMEQLQIRGVAAELAASGTTIGKLVLYGRAAIDLSRLPSRYPSLLITPQSRTEEVLTRRLHRLGWVDRRRIRGDRVAQDANGVEVRVRAADGAERRYRASYVVGADGVHSAVRTALGLPYPGRSVVRSLMLADVRLTDPPADVLAVNGVGDAFAFVAPFGDGWYRVFAWNRLHQVEDTAPVELSEVREATRRALGTDFGMHDPRFLSRFHSDERQVPTLPGRAGVPGRGRGALPLPGRWAGHEHRHPGRGQPRLEAGGRGGRLGRRGVAGLLPGRAPPGGQAGAAQQRAAGPAGSDPAPVGPGRPQCRRHGAARDTADLGQGSRA